MCGIVGVVLPGGAQVERPAVRRMAATLAHRGPDGEGEHFADGVGFGHRRLAVVDLSEASAQPMVSPSGTALTFNGEIYNWRALRMDLASAGRNVASGGDTEVLLAALDTWGTGALPRLEGMFAFGYWDPAARSLWLARDRFGEKPLYYAPLGERGREGLVFASELRALLAHPRVHQGRSIDPVAVAQFFLHEFVPAPRSILANVKKLDAGCRLHWEGGLGLRIETYYEPRLGQECAPRADERELQGELVRLTEASTKARLVADVPVGVFLSGGLDSSFLAACATRVHSRVKTFTVAFDDATFDESAHARHVARHLGTTHVEYRLSTQTLIDLVPSTLDWMDEPLADSSLLPMTLLAREARRDVKVALGGEGGDELLAGYPTFVLERALGGVPALPESVAAVLRQAARAVPRDPGNFSLSFVARQFAQGLGAARARRHALWLAALVPRELGQVAGPRLDPRSVSRAFEATDATDATSDGQAERPSSFDAATAFYLRLYLAEGVLTKVDRATMRASLEARAPLLDTALAEFCLSLPPRLRVRGLTTKWLMRQAVKTMLPPSIVRRPKKGFGAPVGAWLRGPLRPLAEATLTSSRVQEGGWLDPTRIARMLAAHVEGTADHGKALYATFVFEHWRQRAGL